MSDTLTRDLYNELAIGRSEQSARDWLADHDEGFPRSWHCESANSQRRGGELYERDFEAPPIAGYEVLEAAGLVVRGEAMIIRSEERIRFTLTDAGRAQTRGRVSNTDATP